MQEIILGDLTFNVPGSPVTTLTLGLTNGLEYLGDNRPREYEPRLIEFLNLSRTAVGDGKTFGRTDVGTGMVRIANPDGEYDNLINYGGGAAVFRLASSTSADYDTTTVIASVNILRVEADFEEIRVHLQDRSVETEDLFQTDLYLGTNSGSTGVEGLPGDLQGQPRPDALGYVFQVPMRWANQEALILELDSEQIHDIKTLKVYDGLVGITRGTQRLSLAALQSGTPAAGTFDYYLGGGSGAYIKLGDAPEYNMTADIEGKAPGGSFLTLPGQLYDWALQHRAGVPYASISAADLDALLTNAPYDLGIWIDTAINISGVLDLIAASLPGYWYVDALGVYRIKQAKDPTTQTPVATFRVMTPTGTAKSTEGDIVAIERVSTNDAGGGVPVKQVTVKYKKFPQVTDLGFDTASTIAIRSEAKQQWRTVVAADPTVEDVYERAPALEFETALVNKADAETVADTLLALYSVTRDRFRLTVAMTTEIAAVVDLGKYIEVVFPRFGMDSGKVFEVRGIRYRGAAEDEIAGGSALLADLDIWG